MTLPKLNFSRCTIQMKSRAITAITIISLILCSLMANFFFKTGQSLEIIVDALRIQNNTFQEGIEDYYIFNQTKDSHHYAQSILKIEKANQMSMVFGQIHQEAQKLNKEEFEQLIYDTFSEACHQDIETAKLLANRMKLFLRLNRTHLKHSLYLAQESHKKGILIRQKILSHNNHEIQNTLHNELTANRKINDQLATEINNTSISLHKYQSWLSIFFILIMGVIILWISRLINLSITIPIKKIVNSINLLSKGNTSQDLHILGNNEIGQLASAHNLIRSKLLDVVHHTTNVAKGNLHQRLTPASEEDHLTHSLNRMAQRLQESHDKNQETANIQKAFNDMHEVLRGDQDIHETSKNALSFLSNHLKSEMGALYIFDRTQDILKMTAYFGFPEQQKGKEYKPGEGLVGQTFIDKKRKHIKNLPTNYFHISSATGEILPSSILIEPLIFQDEVWGILELAAIHPIDESKLNFLTNINESISINVASSLSRLRMRNLLNKTQSQANELQVQQEELRVANEELTEQTQELTQNEKKLQVQQEELRVANEELEERTHQLELQKQEIQKKNKKLTLAQKHLEKKALELEQSSQYKSEFLANMSHELRTPLNSLLILSGMLAKNKKQNLAPDQIESAQIIHKSGTDLLELINEILDLSKIESGKMSLLLEPTTAEHLSQDVMMNFKHVALDKKLELKISIAPDFPSSFITDSQRISQIIKNLLSNAFKFTSQGTITVSFDIAPKNTAYLNKELKQQTILALSVTDTGVGIPIKKQAAIFEAFQQADGSISRKYGGTGLGLSICRELTRMFKGEIHLKSQENIGSTFTVYLPLIDENHNNDISDIKHNTAPITQKTTSQHLNNNTHNSFTNNKLPKDNTTNTPFPIFIDDDRDKPHDYPLVILIHPHRDEAQILFERIHNMHFNAVVASNTQDALQLIRVYQPIAIIMGIESTLSQKENILDMLKNDAGAGALPLHVINPVEGHLKSHSENLPTAQANELERVIAKIKKQLFSTSKRILVIEDNAMTRRVINNILAPTKVTIDEAESATQAFELIKNQKYDCVILDLGLPDFSGNDLLEKLSQQNIPVPNTIIYTGKELSRDEHRQLSRYTNSIILKGLKSDERLMDEVTLFLHQVAHKLPDTSISETPDLDHSIFKGKKILIVDDEIRNVFALGKILEDKDMEVMEAENGKIALEILNSNHDIDLVLMDIMMPEMDGYEAIRHIRKTSKIKETPVICLTAKAMKEDYDKAIQCGANDYLSKPIDEDKLFSMLKIWLYN